MQDLISLAVAFGPLITFVVFVFCFPASCRKGLWVIINITIIFCLCVQLYYNPYPFSPNPSCVTIPNHPDNRPLSERQESDQSGCSAPKCAHQSNPGLLGCARAPVRLNQNRNDRTARAGAGRTELASQSEAARTTRLFATEQSGINGTRLYSEAVQGNRGYTGGLQEGIQK
jgi:hypothetical protein